MLGHELARLPAETNHEQIQIGHNDTSLDIQYFSAQVYEKQEPKQITLKKGTVKVAE
jgi:hypothetical protein